MAAVLAASGGEGDGAGGPREQAHDALDCCIANVEYFVCVRGSSASGGCTAEALDVTERLQEFYP